MVKLEASFSGRKSSLLVNLADLGIEVIERGAQRAGQMVVSGDERGPLGSQDAEIQLGGKERDFQAVAGGGVAMRLRDAMDQAFESQPAQVVGHLSGGIGMAEARFH